MWMDFHDMDGLELKHLITDDRYQIDAKEIKLQKCTLTCQSTSRITEWQNGLDWKGLERPPGFQPPAVDRDTFH